MSMDRRLYWIWLQRHLPLGSMATNRLLDHFSDIEAVFAAKPAALRCARRNIWSCRTRI